MLEQLFGSKTRVKILKLFFAESDKSFFVRQIVRELKTQINAVRREIKILSDAEIIKETYLSEGLDGGASTKKHYYAANTESPVFNELKALIVKSRFAGEKALVDEMVRKCGRIKLVLLAGIFVNNAESDTDLLIVGTVDGIRLKKVISAFEKKFGQQIRYTAMTEKEFNERRQLTDKFLFKLLEGQKIEAYNSL